MTHQRKDVELNSDDSDNETSHVRQRKEAETRLAIIKWQMSKPTSHKTPRTKPAEKETVAQQVDNFINTRDSKHHKQL